MILFWLTVAVLLIVASGALLMPLMRMPTERPRYLAVLATGAGLPAFSLSVYLLIGHWQSPQIEAQTGADVEAMVGQLATRLQREGGSTEEWRMLGRSYMVMGRYSEAVSAFGRARQLGDDQDPELLALFAEALALTNLDNLKGEAGSLFERVLTLRPRDPKALWYGAAAAQARGDSALAIERWQLLMSMNPPEALRQVLENRLREAGAEAPVAPNAASIEIVVSLDDDLATELPANTSVFVIARAEGGGAPLAVRRLLVSELPARVILSEADAMLPGRTISTHEVAEFTARVALSGTPEARPGDWFVAVPVSAREIEQPVTLNISQRVP